MKNFEPKCRHKTRYFFFAKNLLMALILFLFCSCVFKIEQVYPDLPPFKKNEEINENKKRIFIQVDSTVIINNQITNPSSLVSVRNNRYKEKFKDEIESTGSFICTNDKDSFDYRIDISIISSLNQNINLLLISGLTLLLVPNFSSGNLMVKFRVSDFSGKVIGQVDREEHSRTTTQLFLILYALFDWPWAFIKPFRQESRLIRSAAIEIDKLLNFNELPDSKPKSADVSKLLFK